MVNLLIETVGFLEDHDKTPKDVLWVSDGENWQSWDEFAAVADIEYYDGFGCAEIKDDLVVIGSNWWLERHEYDGAEWWEFKTIPNITGKIHQSLLLLNS